jgi:O-antigen ligase
MTTRAPRTGGAPGGGRERLTFGHGLFAPVPTPIATVPALANEPKPVRLSHPETWDWGWGGLLLFSILLFFRPQEQLAWLGHLHLSDIAAAIGLTAMVMINLGRRESPIRVTPEVVGVFLLGGVILATTPFSIWPGGSLTVFTDMFIQVSLIFLLLVNTVRSPRRIERITWVIVLAFGYISARVIVDYLMGVNLVEGHRAAGPVGGFFANPNDLALNLAAFMPLTLMYVLRPGSTGRRLLCASFAVMMFMAIIFTKSRAGMIGLAVMIVVFVLSARLLTPKNIILGILAGLLVLPALPTSFWERAESIIDPSKDDTGSREERRRLMTLAWNTFLEHPITGIGAGQFRNYAPEGAIPMWRVSHNAILQVAAELGIVGLAAFLFLIYRGFGAAWWTRRTLMWIHWTRPKRRKAAPARDPEDGLDEHDRLFLQTHSAAMVTALAAWLVSAMFASVAFNWTFYYLLGLSVAARDVVRARARAYAKAKALAAKQQQEAA